MVAAWLWSLWGIDCQVPFLRSLKIKPDTTTFKPNTNTKNIMETLFLVDTMTKCFHQVWCRCMKARLRFVLHFLIDSYVIRSIGFSGKTFSPIKNPHNDFCTARSQDHLGKIGENQTQTVTCWHALNAAWAKESCGATFVKIGHTVSTVTCINATPNLTCWWR